jgi:hypothetical protein
LLGEELSGLQVAGFALALAAVLAGQLPSRGQQAARVASGLASASAGIQPLEVVR